MSCCESWLPLLSVSVHEHANNKYVRIIKKIENSLWVPPIWEPLWHWSGNWIVNKPEVYATALLPYHVDVKEWGHCPDMLKSMGAIAPIAPMFPPPLPCLVCWVGRAHTLCMPVHLSLHNYYYAGWYLKYHHEFFATRVSSLWLSSSSTDRPHHWDIPDGI